MLFILSCLVIAGVVCYLFREDDPRDNDQRFTDRCLARKAKSASDLPVSCGVGRIYGNAVVEFVCDYAKIVNDYR